jgi:hypothetical protein
VVSGKSFSIPNDKIRMTSGHVGVNLQMRSTIWS